MMTRRGMFGALAGLFVARPSAARDVIREGRDPRFDDGTHLKHALESFSQMVTRDPSTPLFVRSYDGRLSEPFRQKEGLIYLPPGVDLDAWRERRLG